MTTVANQPTIWNTSTNTQRKTSAGISRVLAGFLGWAAAPAAAQTPANNLFEWECPLGGQQVPNADPFPGALLAGRRPPHLVRHPRRCGRSRSRAPGAGHASEQPRHRACSPNDQRDLQLVGVRSHRRLPAVQNRRRLRLCPHRDQPPPHHRRSSPQLPSHLSGQPVRVLGSRADRRRHNCRTASGLFDGHGGHRPLAPGTDADQR